MRIAKLESQESEACGSVFPTAAGYIASTGEQDRTNKDVRWPVYDLTCDLLT